MIYLVRSFFRLFAFGFFDVFKFIDDASQIDVLVLASCYHRGQTAPELSDFPLDIRLVVAVEGHVALILLVRNMMMLVLLVNVSAGLFLLLRSSPSCSPRSRSILTVEYGMSSLGSAPICSASSRSLRRGSTPTNEHQLFRILELAPHNHLPPLVDVDCLLLRERSVEVIVAVPLAFSSLFEPVAEELQLGFESIGFCRLVVILQGLLTYFMEF